MAAYTFISGDEKREFSFGETEDGMQYVRQVSEGDLTKFAFGSSRHTITVSFPKNDCYDLTDIMDDIDHRRDDCHIEDFEQILALWSIPFKHTEHDLTLVS